MYRFFGINIKNQEVNNVPGSLKEMLELHPELWNKITDIKFEDGTTVHQKNGKFNNYEYENAKEYRRTLGCHYSVNDENYSCYSVKFNDIEKGSGPEEDEKYFKTSMSFIDGKLQSTEPLDENYKEISSGIKLPAIILKNGKSYVECMTMMWHDKGKLNSFDNFPSIIKNKPAVYNKGCVYVKPVTYQLQYHNDGKIDKCLDFYPLDYQNNSRECWRYLYNIMTNIENFQKQYLKIIENGNYNDFLNLENIQEKHHGLGSNLYYYVKYNNKKEQICKQLNCTIKIKDIHNGYFRGYIKDNKGKELYLTQEHTFCTEPYFNSEITYENKGSILHREDGPARISKNYKDNTISYEYYLNDIEYSYEEFKKELKLKEEEENLLQKIKIQESILYEELYL
jgi:hypothetical protein